MYTIKMKYIQKPWELHGWATVEMTPQENYTCTA